MPQPRKPVAESSSSDVCFDGGECRRVVDEFKRQRKNASEYAGSAGAVMKGGCERLGVERRALALAATLDAKDPAKRAAFLRDLLRVAHALGHFQQIDAFDDLTPLLEKIGEECRTREQTPARADDAATLNDVLKLN